MQLLKVMQMNQVMLGFVKKRRTLLNKKIKSNQIENFMQNGKFCFLFRNNNRAVCLICRQDFAQFEIYSFDRHFKSTHSAIDEKFPFYRQNNEPMKSEIRCEISKSKPNSII